ncbi:hypothetical protein [uncultured Aquimarina sp.]|uniref:hypothetical protein n=1 Tax=uncultured Aquimarina sp. TaxID=575652 RepID=UPI0026227639|nr:hypothetical protein [uncultured Aquimarina sp.]
MKIKHFTQAFIVFGLLLFVSCNEDETTTETTEQLTEDVFAKNWQEADLSKFFTGAEMNYPIATQQLKNVLNHKDVYQIRFVPGILNNELLVKVVSIDATGKVLAEELVKQFKDLTLQSQLEKLRTSNFDKESITDPLVSKHILPFNDAASYLNSWMQKSYLDIDEMTSYNGMRIRHFALEPVVIKHMIALESDTISLFWGINQENKLTTVFVPISNNSIIAATKNGGSGPAYDFTSPCPNLCDPD